MVKVWSIEQRIAGTWHTLEFTDSRKDAQQARQQLMRRYLVSRWNVRTPSYEIEPTAEAIANFLNKHRQQ